MSVERSVRGRIAIALSPRAAGLRVSSAAPAAVQIAVAASVAYSIAHFGFGHATPLLSVTMTLSSLGFLRDARPARVLETALGLTVGIALAEVLLLIAGQGVWQLGVALVVTLLVARLLGASPQVAIAAAGQSALVVLLPAPAGGPFVRSLDGVIGGVVALVATALVPRDPRRAAIRTGHALFRTCQDAVADIEQALRFADPAAAHRALERLRSTQPVLDSWATELNSATAIAKVSPFLRRHLADLEMQQQLRGGMDLATRSLRIISRRVDFLVEDDRPRPELAGLLDEVGDGLELLRRGMREQGYRESSRAALLRLAERLDPRVLIPDGAITEALIVVLVRPLVVDLLTASGTPPTDARAALPDLDT